MKISTAEAHPFVTEVMASYNEHCTEFDNGTAIAALGFVAAEIAVSIGVPRAELIRLMSEVLGAAYDHIVACQAAEAVRH